MKADLITEAEARRIGNSATRIAQFRAVQRAAGRGGSISFQTDNGAMSLSLNQVEMEAVTAFLIEREAQFLGSYGVMVEGAVVEDPTP